MYQPVTVTRTDYEFVYRVSTGRPQPAPPRGKAGKVRSALKVVLQAQLISFIYRQDMRVVHLALLHGFQAKFASYLHP